MKYLILAVLLLASMAPAMAARYEDSTYTRPLQQWCAGVGDVAGMIAGYRDDGFKEQAVLAVLRHEAPKAHDPRWSAENEDNVTMVYHMGGWMMSTPDQIAQGAYENCLAKHGPETWWRRSNGGAP